MGYMKTFSYKKSDYPPGSFPYQLNDSMKILLGVLYIHGSSSVYISSTLTVIEINDLPYSIEPGLTIIGVDKNGTVELSCNNTSFYSTPETLSNLSINLSPGATWGSAPISAWNETNVVKYPPPDPYTGIDSGTNYTYTLHYVKTLTLENKGVFDK